jgi:hypothetical protein
MRNPRCGGTCGDGRSGVTSFAASILSGITSWISCVSRRCWSSRSMAASTSQAARMTRAEQPGSNSEATLCSASGTMMCCKERMRYYRRYGVSWSGHFDPHPNLPPARGKESTGRVAVSTGDGGCSARTRCSRLWQGTGCHRAWCVAVPGTTIRGTRAAPTATGITRITSSNIWQRQPGFSCGGVHSFSSVRPADPALHGGGTVPRREASAARPGSRPLRGGRPNIERPRVLPLFRCRGARRGASLGA